MNEPLGSVHTALAIAIALAMTKSSSSAIAVLAKEWVGMPFLSKILSENLSFSSLAQLSLRNHILVLLSLRISLKPV